MKDLELLADKKILIVKDENFLARGLQRELEALGVEVVGPVATVPEALSILASGRTIDGAVLDIELGGEQVYPVADLLQRLSIPFVFATGRDPGKASERYPGFVFCGEPAQLSEIARALFGAERSRLH